MSIVSIARQLLLSSILCLLFTSLMAQNDMRDYTLLLKTRKYIPEACAQLPEATTKSLEQKVFNGRYYAILQFYDIPNSNQRTDIKTMGIELLKYIPNFAYIAAVPPTVSESGLESVGVRAINLLRAEDKVAPQLLEAEQKSAKSSEVLIHLYQYNDAPQVKTSLAAKGISVEGKNEGKHIQVRLSFKQIEEVAQLPFVQYIEPISEPMELLGTRSKSVRGRYINSAYGGGLKGNGVIVGIGDGGGAQHLDFVGRTESYVVEDHLQDDNHANLVAGMLGGGGVLRERVKGIAPEADLLFYYKSHVLDNDNVNANVANGMVLTNNSYGAGEGGAYNYLSERCDDQLIAHPQLMHVFGVGNSGKKAMQKGYPVTYNTVLTSGQSSKNAISVGGINHYNELYTKSSKGPTADGRLKPEISAIGYSFVSPGGDNNYGDGYGTSFSAPQVTGGLALLYEQYRNTYNEDPKAALMKAILCNTAEDLGNPGPDFTYGFGKMNLRRAKKLLDGQQYLTDIISNDEKRNYNINVPANLTELKVMLYWPDPSAAALADKTLVNDLDLLVFSPTTSYRPFVLNTTPTNVADDAYPYADRINNIEQVVIKNPVPGNYTFKIDGFHVPDAVQEFYIVYEYVEAGVVLTSPIPEEVLPGGGSTNYYIEWDYNGANDYIGNGQEEDFTVEYSPDGGNTWNVLSDSIDSNTRIYRWDNELLAGINSSDVLVKVTKNGTPYSDVVESPCKLYDFISRNEYSIIPLCNDEVLFEWKNIEDAVAYELLAYQDGSEMEFIASTADTSYTHTYDYDMGERWFSVRAVYPDDTRSITADAKLFTPPVPTFISSCPPSAPDNIHYETGQYHVQFFWEAATDDLEVTGYVIYMNGIPTDTVTSLDYMVYDTPGVNVEYCISAIDEHNNESYPSCFSTSTFSEDFCNRDILLVTKNKTLTDDEVIIQDYLQSADYSVFTADVNVLENYLWNKNWTIIISPEAEIASADVQLFDDLPVIIMNFDMLETFDMSTGSAEGVGNLVDVISPYHPAAAGMSGELDFFTGDYYFKAAIHTSPDAIPITRYLNNYNIMFAYEAGSTMLNGVVAQKKRVGFPLEPDNVQHFTTRAWILLNAALAWTADCTVTPAMSPPNIDLSPDFTSIDVQWDTPASFDDITKYAIYLNDRFVGTTTDNHYTINNLNPSTYYKVSVSSLNIQQVESTRTYNYTTTLTCKDLEIYVWLEGALHEQQISIMRTALNQLGQLPGQANNEDEQMSEKGHPYYLPPWNYNLEEVVPVYESDVVDRVLVSFRTTPSTGSEVFRTVGVLHADGLISFPRECIDYEFTDPVYIVIEHRNHLAVMSAVPVTMINDYIYYDFRNKNSYVNSGSGQKEIFPNIFAMYAGDCEQQNDFGGYQIEGNDKVPWQIRNGMFNIYTPEDMNLDGDVNGLDKQLWSANNGIYSSVPR